MQLREPEHVRQGSTPGIHISDVRLGCTPPQNIELEMCVLGAIMLDPKNAYPVAEDFLTKEAFYLDGHGVIFQLMGELYHRGTPPDSDMVLDELRSRNLLDQVGGAAVILSMLNSVASAASIEYHAKRIAEKALLRAMIRAMTQIIEECYRQELEFPQVIEQVEQTLVELSKSHSAEHETTIHKSLTQYWDDLKLRCAKRQELLAAGKDAPTGTGLPTGMIDADQVTGGMREGELIILAARPSMGKTALALNYLNHTVDQLKVPALMFSLEMKQDPLMERMLSLRTRHWINRQLQGIAGRELQAAEIHDDSQWNVLTQAYNELLSQPLYICDTARTLSQIKSVARLHKVHHGIGMIVVDYLQLVEMPEVSGRNREQEVSKISRGMKNLALELNLPIVLLSQLSREVTKVDRRPQLSDLRESGAIEQDADVVQFLHNTDFQKMKTERWNCSDCHGDYINGRCDVCGGLLGVDNELIISKNRNGPTAIVNLAWTPAIYWFGPKSNRKP